MNATDSQHILYDVDPFDWARDIDSYFHTSDMVNKYYQVRPSIYADVSDNKYINGKLINWIEK